MYSSTVLEYYNFELLPFSTTLYFYFATIQMQILYFLHQYIYLITLVTSDFADLDTKYNQQKNVNRLTH